jgi:hypothetical protein
MTWLDPDRVCHCLLHEPVEGQEASFNDHDRKLIEDVEMHGWHLVMIATDATTEGWVFSVGMWHTLASPELAIFGMQANHAANVLNQIGDRVRAGQGIGPDVVVADVLEEGRTVGFRAVDDSWYRPMFGYATWFGQLPPLPIAQAVWSDRDGRFPWDEDADPDGASQPSLWIPADQHPIGPWSGMLPERPWAFPDRPDARSFTTRRVAIEKAPIAFVSHDQDGAWQFIDAEPWVAEDVLLLHLGHVVEQDPTLEGLADLPIGWEASRDGPDAPWTRRALAPGPASEPQRDEPSAGRWPWSRRRT